MSLFAQKEADNTILSYKLVFLLELSFFEQHLSVVQMCNCA